MNIGLLPATVFLAGIAIAQTSTSEQAPASLPASGGAQTDASVHTSAKHDIGSGAGDIGKGAAKGVGSAARGTGKAAIDLVTLHPINAATDLGKGAVNTGKNVGVGTVKGTAKIFKGTGKAIKHLFYLDYARNLSLRRVCSGDVPAADPQAVLSFS
jgi:hypothetical protein